MSEAKIETGDYVFVDAKTACGVEYRKRVLRSRIVTVQYEGRRPKRYTVDRSEPLIYGNGLHNYGYLFDTNGRKEVYG